MPDAEHPRLGETMLSVCGVGKTYRRGRNERYEAVADVSFEVGAGEVVCIVGKTGCGKSTLVSLILGLERPTSGHVRVAQKSPTAEFSGLRSQIAAVFQSDRLLPWASVVDNAALGLEACGVGRSARHKEALAWLERLGLGGWEDTYPRQLSGGMRQRVAIARAFTVDPPVLLLDEAFGHLDEVTAEGLRDDFLRLVRESNKTALMVTHDIEEALHVGHRVICLSRPASVIATHDTELIAKGTVPQELNQLKQQVFQEIEQQDSGVRERDGKGPRGPKPGTR